MSPCRIFASALTTLCAVVGAHGAEGSESWARIKAGMTRKEMATALGEPLMKSSGRQFELCIYDAGAEVLCFRGAVVAWTAPAGSAAPEGRQLDLTSLLQPAPVQAKPAPKVYVPHSERGGGFERISPRRSRLPRW